MNTGKIIDKILNFFFDKKNLCIIGILLLALILRVIVASNVGPLADEMNVAVRSIDVHKSGTMNSVDECHSFYYLNEIVYKLTGNINLLTARFTSILFGLLSILMIYLIVMKLYKNEKIALTACFLAAISGFQIRFSLAEMDITMAFFVLLSTYAFLTALYDRKDKWYYLSAIFLGLAVAIKTFAGIWVLSYFAFAIYYSFKNKEYRQRYLGRRGIKVVLICAIIIFIFIIPTIIANYLLYKDKGIVDFQVARFFGINKEYWQKTGLGGIDNPFMISQLKTGIVDASFTAFKRYDWALSLLGVIGFLVMFIKYKEQSIFLFLWFIFDYLFIAGTAWLDTHFVFNTLIFAIFAAVFLVEIDNRLKNKFRYFLAIILITVLVINLFILAPFMTSQTAMAKMIAYKNKNIGDNDLVIVDQRIFRGRTALMFYDKAYVESETLGQLMNAVKDSKEQAVPIKTFFIEAAEDDYGWGTIGSQPELNASVENQIKLIESLTSMPGKIIYGGGGYGEDTGPWLKVHELTLNLKPSVLKLTKQTHYHFLYPVGWEGEIFDKYQIYSDFDNLMNKFGFLIFYLTIGLEVLSPFIIIWFFIKSRNKD